MRISRDDFRQHPRTRVSMPVKIDLEESERQTLSVNVSHSGMALYKPENAAIEPGQQVTITFSPPRPRRFMARVIHVSDTQIGLKFETHDRPNVDDFIEKAAIKSSPVTDEAIPKKSCPPPTIPHRLKTWCVTQARRAGILAINGPLQPLIVATVKPRFLFAAYGTPKEAASYMSPWMQRVLPTTFIGGVIRANGNLGFMVAAKDLEDTLYTRGDRMRAYLEDLQKRFPGAERIALVGRLPNFARKAGVTLAPPFVDGAMGTRFMILDAALQLKALPHYQERSGITVLGGAGRIGDQVCGDLLTAFDEVIAFDPRYAQEEVTRIGSRRLIRTANVAHLQKHRMFIGLTHHGDAVIELLAHLPPGSTIADDTHPCISAAAREALKRRGIDTRKIVLTHPRFSMQPRMPAWNATDIPGCLVEALVLLEHGPAATQSFQAFSLTARRAGFRGVLVAPPQA